MRKVIIIVAIIATVVAIIFFTGKKNYQDLNKDLKNSRILHNLERSLPAFSLITQDSKPFNNKDLLNKWSLVFFGFTNCPDVCPTGMMDMVNLKKSLSVPIELLLVTLDPIRDTPQVLKTYVSHFDKNFIGLSSATRKTIDALIRPFGTYYERVIYDDNGKQQIIANDVKLTPKQIAAGYLVNHTAWIYLISPDGEIFAGFPTPHDINDMTDDIKLMMTNY